MPRGEEQSINTVFHSRMPRSRVIVADITKVVKEWKTNRIHVLELFREPLKIDQISQKQKFVPR